MFDLSFIFNFPPGQGHLKKRWRLVLLPILNLWALCSTPFHAAHPQSVWHERQVPLKGFYVDPSRAFDRASLALPLKHDAYSVGYTLSPTLQSLIWVNGSLYGDPRFKRGAQNFSQWSKDLGLGSEAGLQWRKGNNIRLCVQNLARSPLRLALYYQSLLWHIAFFQKKESILGLEWARNFKLFSKQIGLFYLRWTQSKTGSSFALAQCDLGLKLDWGRSKKIRIRAPPYRQKNLKGQSNGRQLPDKQAFIEALSLHDQFQEEASGSPAPSEKNVDAQEVRSENLHLSPTKSAAGNESAAGSSGGANASFQSCFLANSGSSDRGFNDSNVFPPALLEMPEKHHQETVLQIHEESSAKPYAQRVIKGEFFENESRDSSEESSDNKPTLEDSRGGDDLSTELVKSGSQSTDLLQESTKASDLMRMNSVSESFSADTDTPAMLEEFRHYYPENGPQPTDIDQFVETFFGCAPTDAEGLSYNRLSRDQMSFFLGTKVHLAHTNAQCIIFDCDASFPQELATTIVVLGAGADVLLHHQTGWVIHALRTQNVCQLTLSTQSSQGAKDGFEENEDSEGFSALLVLDEGITALHGTAPLKTLRLLSPEMFIDASMLAQTIQCHAGTTLKSANSALQYFKDASGSKEGIRRLQRRDLSFGPKAYLQAAVRLHLSNEAVGGSITQVQRQESSISDRRAPLPRLEAPQIDINAPQFFEWSGTISLGNPVAALSKWLKIGCKNIQLGGRLHTYQAVSHLRSEEITFEESLKWKGDDFYCWGAKKLVTEQGLTSQSRLILNGQVHIQAQNWIHQGEIQSLGSLLQWSGDNFQQGGKIKLEEGHLQLIGKRITLSPSGVMVAKNCTIVAQNLEVYKNLTEAHETTGNLHCLNQLNCWLWDLHHRGDIRADGDLTIAAMKAKIFGSLKSQQSLSLKGHWVELRDDAALKSAGHCHILAPKSFYAPLALNPDERVNNVYSRQLAFLHYHLLNKDGDKKHGTLQLGDCVLSCSTLLLEAEELIVVGGRVKAQGLAEYSSLASIKPQMSGPNVRIARVMRQAWGSVEVKTNNFILSGSLELEQGQLSIEATQGECKPQSRLTANSLLVKEKNGSSTFSNTSLTFQLKGEVLLEKNLVIEGNINVLAGGVIAAQTSIGTFSSSQVHFDASTQLHTKSLVIPDCESFHIAAGAKIIVEGDVKVRATALLIEGELFATGRIELEWRGTFYQKGFLHSSEKEIVLYGLSKTDPQALKSDVRFGIGSRTVAKGSLYIEAGQCILASAFSKVASIESTEGEIRIQTQHLNVFGLVHAQQDVIISTQKFCTKGELHSKQGHIFINYSKKKPRTPSSGGAEGALLEIEDGKLIAGKGVWLNAANIRMHSNNQEQQPTITAGKNIRIFAKELQTAGILSATQGIKLQWCGILKQYALLRSSEGKVYLKARSKKHSMLLMEPHSAISASNGRIVLKVPIISGTSSAQRCPTLRAKKGVHIFNVHVYLKGVWSVVGGGDLIVSWKEHLRSDAVIHSEGSVFMRSIQHLEALKNERVMMIWLNEGYLNSSAKFSATSELHSEKDIAIGSGQVTFEGRATQKARVDAARNVWVTSDRCLQGGNFFAAGSVSLSGSRITLSGNVSGAEGINIEFYQDYLQLGTLVSKQDVRVNYTIRPVEGPMDCLKSEQECFPGIDRNVASSFFSKTKGFGAFFAEGSSIRGEQIVVGLEELWVKQRIGEFANWVAEKNLCVRAFKIHQEGWWQSGGNLTIESRDVSELSGVLRAENQLRLQAPIDDQSGPIKNGRSTFTLFGDLTLDALNMVCFSPIIAEHHLTFCVGKSFRARGELQSLNGSIVFKTASSSELHLEKRADWTAKLLIIRGGSTVLHGEGVLNVGRLCVELSGDFAVFLSKIEAAIIDLRCTEAIRLNREVLAKESLLCKSNKLFIEECAVTKSQNMSVVCQEHFELSKFALSADEPERVAFYVAGDLAISAKRIIISGKIKAFNRVVLNALKDLLLHGSVQSMNDAIALQSTESRNHQSLYLGEHSSVRAATFIVLKGERIEAHGTMNCDRGHIDLSSKESLIQPQSGASIVTTALSIDGTKASLWDSPSIRLQDLKINLLGDFCLEQFNGPDHQISLGDQGTISATNIVIKGKLQSKNGLYLSFSAELVHSGLLKSLKKGVSCYDAAIVRFREKAPEAALDFSAIKLTASAARFLEGSQIIAPQLISIACGTIEHSGKWQVEPQEQQEGETQEQQIESGLYIECDTLHHWGELESAQGTAINAKKVVRLEGHSSVGAATFIVLKGERIEAHGTMNCNRGHIDLSSKESLIQPQSGASLVTTMLSINGTKAFLWDSPSIHLQELKINLLGDFCLEQFNCPDHQISLGDQGTISATNIVIKGKLQSKNGLYLCFSAELVHSGLLKSLKKGVSCYDAAIARFREKAPETAWDFSAIKLTASAARFGEGSQIIAPQLISIACGTIEHSGKWQVEPQEQQEEETQEQQIESGLYIECDRLHHRGATKSVQGATIRVTKVLRLDPGSATEKNAENWDLYLKAPSQIIAERFEHYGRMYCASPCRFSFKFWINKGRIEWPLQCASPDKEQLSFFEFGSTTQGQSASSLRFSFENLRSVGVCDHFEIALNDLCPVAAGFDPNHDTIFLKFENNSSVNLPFQFKVDHPEKLLRCVALYNTTASAVETTLRPSNEKSNEEKEFQLLFNPTGIDVTSLSSLQFTNQPLLSVRTPKLLNDSEKNYFFYQGDLFLNLSGESYDHSFQLEVSGNCFITANKLNLSKDSYIHAKSLSIFLPTETAFLNLEGGSCLSAVEGLRIQGVNSTIFNGGTIRSAEEKVCIEAQTLENSGCGQIVAPSLDIAVKSLKNYQEGSTNCSRGQGPQPFIFAEGWSFNQKTEETTEECVLCIRADEILNQFAQIVAHGNAKIELYSNADACLSLQQTSFLNISADVHAVGNLTVTHPFIKNLNALFSLKYLQGSSSPPNEEYHLILGEKATPDEKRFSSKLYNFTEVKGSFWRSRRMEVRSKDGKEYYQGSAWRTIKTKPCTAHQNIISSAPGSVIATGTLCFKTMKDPENDASCIRGQAIRYEKLGDQPGNRPEIKNKNLIREVQRWDEETIIVEGCVRAFNTVAGAGATAWGGGAAGGGAASIVAVISECTGLLALGAAAPVIAGCGVFVVAGGMVMSAGVRELLTTNQDLEKMSFSRNGPKHSWTVPLSDQDLQMTPFDDQASLLKSRCFYLVPKSHVEQAGKKVILNMESTIQRRQAFRASMPTQSYRNSKLKHNSEAGIFSAVQNAGLETQHTISTDFVEVYHSRSDSQSSSPTVTVEAPRAQDSGVGPPSESMQTSSEVSSTTFFVQREEDAQARGAYQVAPNVSSSETQLAAGLDKLQKAYPLLEKVYPLEVTSLLTFENFFNLLSLIKVQAHRDPELLARLPATLSLEEVECFRAVLGPVIFGIDSLVERTNQTPPAVRNSAERHPPAQDGEQKISETSADVWKSPVEELLDPMLFNELVKFSRRILILDQFYRFSLRHRDPTQIQDCGLMKLREVLPSQQSSESRLEAPGWIEETYFRLSKVADQELPGGFGSTVSETEWTTSLNTRLENQVFSTKKYEFFGEYFESTMESVFLAEIAVFSQPKSKKGRVLLQGVVCCKELYGDRSLTEMNGAKVIVKRFNWKGKSLKFGVLKDSFEEALGALYHEFKELIDKLEGIHSQVTKIAGKANELQQGYSAMIQSIGADVLASKLRLFEELPFFVGTELTSGKSTQPLQKKEKSKFSKWYFLARERFRNFSSVSSKENSKLSFSLGETFKKLGAAIKDFLGTASNDSLKRLNQQGLEAYCSACSSVREKSVFYGPALEKRQEEFKKKLKEVQENLIEYRQKQDKQGYSEANSILNGLPHLKDLMAKVDTSSKDISCEELKKILKTIYTEAEILLLCGDETAKKCQLILEELEAGSVVFQIKEFLKAINDYNAVFNVHRAPQKEGYVENLKSSMEAHFQALQRSLRRLQALSTLQPPTKQITIEDLINDTTPDSSSQELVPSTIKEAFKTLASAVAGLDGALNLENTTIDKKKLSFWKKQTKNARERAVEDLKNIFNAFKEVNERVDLASGQTEQREAPKTWHETLVQAHKSSKILLGKTAEDLLRNGSSTFESPLDETGKDASEKENPTLSELSELFKKASTVGASDIEQESRQINFLKFFEKILQISKNVVNFQPINSFLDCTLSCFKKMDYIEAKLAEVNKMKAFDEISQVKQELLCLREVLGVIEDRSSSLQAASDHFNKMVLEFSQTCEQIPQLKYFLKRFLSLIGSQGPGAAGGSAEEGGGQLRSQDTLEQLLSEVKAWVKESFRDDSKPSGVPDQNQTTRIATFQNDIMDIFSEKVLQIHNNLKKLDPLVTHADVINEKDSSLDKKIKNLLVQVEALEAKPEVKKLTQGLSGLYLLSEELSRETDTLASCAIFRKGEHTSWKNNFNNVKANEDQFLFLSRYYKKEDVYDVWGIPEEKVSPTQFYLYSDLPSTSDLSKKQQESTSPFNIDVERFETCNASILVDEGNASIRGERILLSGIEVDGPAMALSESTENIKWSAGIGGGLPIGPLLDGLNLTYESLKKSIDNPMDAGLRERLAEASLSIFGASTHLGATFLNLFNSGRAQVDSSVPINVLQDILRGIFTLRCLLQLEENKAGSSVKIHSRVWSPTTLEVRKGKLFLDITKEAKFVGSYVTAQEIEFSGSNAELEVVAGKGQEWITNESSKKGKDSSLSSGLSLGSGIPIASALGASAGLTSCKHRIRSREEILFPSRIKADQLILGTEEKELRKALFKSSSAEADNIRMKIDRLEVISEGSQKHELQEVLLFRPNLSVNIRMNGCGRSIPACPSGESSNSLNQDEGLPAKTSSTGLDAVWRDTLSNTQVITTPSTICAKSALTGEVADCRLKGGTLIQKDTLSEKTVLVLKEISVDIAENRIDTNGVHLEGGAHLDLLFCMQALGKAVTTNIYNVCRNILENFLPSLGKFSLVPTESKTECKSRCNSLKGCKKEDQKHLEVSFIKIELDSSEEYGDLCGKSQKREKDALLQKDYQWGEFLEMVRYLVPNDFENSQKEATSGKEGDSADKGQFVLSEKKAAPGTVFFVSLQEDHEIFERKRTAEKHKAESDERLLRFAKQAMTRFVSESIEALRHRQAHNLVQKLPNQPSAPARVPLKFMNGFQPMFTKAHNLVSPKIIGLNNRLSGPRNSNIVNKVLNPEGAFQRVSWIGLDTMGTLQRHGDLRTVSGAIASSVVAREGVFAANWVAKSLNLQFWPRQALGMTPPILSGAIDVWWTRSAGPSEAAALAMMQMATKSHDIYRIKRLENVFHEALRSRKLPAEDEPPPVIIFSVSDPEFNQKCHWISEDILKIRRDELPILCREEQWYQTAALFLQGIVDFALSCRRIKPSRPLSMREGWFEDRARLIPRQRRQYYNFEIDILHTFAKEARKKFITEAQKKFENCPDIGIIKKPIKKPIKDTEEVNEPIKDTEEVNEPIKDTEEVNEPIENLTLDEKVREFELQTRFSTKTTLIDVPVWREIIMATAEEVAQSPQGGVLGQAAKTFLEEMEKNPGSSGFGFETFNVFFYSLSDIEKEEIFKKYGDKLQKKYSDGSIESRCSLLQEVAPIRESLSTLQEFLNLERKSLDRFLKGALEAAAAELFRALMTNKNKCLKDFLKKNPNVEGDLKNKKRSYSEVILELSKTDEGQKDSQIQAFIKDATVQTDESDQDALSEYEAHAPERIIVQRGRKLGISAKLALKAFHRLQKNAINTISPKNFITTAVFLTELIEEINRTALIALKEKRNNEWFLQSCFGRARNDFDFVESTVKQLLRDKRIDVSQANPADFDILCTAKKYADENWTRDVLLDVGETAILTGASLVCLNCLPAYMGLTRGAALFIHQAAPSVARIVTSTIAGKEAKQIIKTELQHLLDNAPALAFMALTGVDIPKSSKVAIAGIIFGSHAATTYYLEPEAGGIHALLRSMSASAVFVPTSVIFKRQILNACVSPVLPHISSFALQNSPVIFYWARGNISGKELAAQLSQTGAAFLGAMAGHYGSRHLGCRLSQNKLRDRSKEEFISHKGRDKALENGSQSNPVEKHSSRGKVQQSSGLQKKLGEPEAVSKASDVVTHAAEKPLGQGKAPQAQQSLGLQKKSAEPAAASKASDVVTHAAGKSLGQGKAPQDQQSLGLQKKLGEPAAVSKVSDVVTHAAENSLGQSKTQPTQKSSGLQKKLGESAAVSKVSDVVTHAAENSLGQSKTQLAQKASGLQKKLGETAAVSKLSDVAAHAAEKPLGQSKTQPTQQSSGLQKKLGDSAAVSKVSDVAAHAAEKPLGQSKTQPAQKSSGLQKKLGEPAAGSKVSDVAAHAAEKSLGQSKTQLAQKASGLQKKLGETAAVSKLSDVAAHAAEKPLDQGKAQQAQQSLGLQKNLGEPAAVSKVSDVAAHAAEKPLGQGKAPQAQQSFGLQKKLGEPEAVSKASDVAAHAAEKPLGQGKAPQAQQSLRLQKKLGEPESASKASDVAAHAAEKPLGPSKTQPAQKSSGLQKKLGEPAAGSKVSDVAAHAAEKPLGQINAAGLQKKSVAPTAASKATEEHPNQSRVQQSSLTQQHPGDLAVDTRSSTATISPRAAAPPPIQKETIALLEQKQSPPLKTAAAPHREHLQQNKSLPTARQILVAETEVIVSRREGQQARCHPIRGPPEKQNHSEDKILLRISCSEVRRHNPTGSKSGQWPVFFRKIRNVAPEAQECMHRLMQKRKRFEGTVIFAVDAQGLFKVVYCVENRVVQSVISSSSFYSNRKLQKAVERLRTHVEECRGRCITALPKVSAVVQNNHLDLNQEPIKFQRGIQGWLKKKLKKFIKIERKENSQAGSKTKQEAQNSSQYHLLLKEFLRNIRKGRMPWHHDYIINPAENGMLQVRVMRGNKIHKIYLCTPEQANQFKGLLSAFQGECAEFVAQRTLPNRAIKLPPGTQAFDYYIKAEKRGVNVKALSIGDGDPQKFNRALDGHIACFGRAIKKQKTAKEQAEIRTRQKNSETEEVDPIRPPEAQKALLLDAELHTLHLVVPAKLTQQQWSILQERQERLLQGNSTMTLEMTTLENLKTLENFSKKGD